METFENQTGWVGAVNVILFAVNAYLFWRRGGNRVTDDIMELYEKNVQALKERINTQDDEILREREAKHELINEVQKIKLELGLLRKDLETRDQKLDEYKDIILNRNPELDQTLIEIRDFMKILTARLEVKPVKNGKSKRTISSGK